MKNYKIPAHKIVPLIDNKGGCLITDKVTVDNMPILYMYREKSINNLDSGWRFFSGFEDEAYMANNDNHGVYDLNTAANYSPEIIPFLDYPVGSELERDGENDDFELIKL